MADDRKPEGRRGRVLIVTSSFTPAVGADMHRARMLTVGLPEAGWDVEILTPGSEFLPTSRVEPDTLDLLEPGTVVHQVRPWSAAAFKIVGVGSMGWLAFVPLLLETRLLLRGGRFDLVYFSTTQFNLFLIGRLMKAMHGLPYVLDIHDPWYDPSPQYIMTRHKVKYRVSLALARYLEPLALGGAGGLIAVSSQYIESLRERYRERRFRCFDEGFNDAIPFGGSERDHEIALARKSAPRPRDEGGDGTADILYIGAGGTRLELAFRHLVGCVRRLRERGVKSASRVRFRLLGTHPDDPGEPRLFESIANGAGVGDAFLEDPEKVDFLTSIRMLHSAAGVFILGVDDPAYIPSKLFHFALSGRPLLASMHPRSESRKYFDECPDLGYLILFGGGEEESDTSVEQFLAEVVEGQRVDRARAIDRFLAPGMARRHAALFDAVVRGHGRDGGRGSQPRVVVPAGRLRCL